MEVPVYGILFLKLLETHQVFHALIKTAISKFIISKRIKERESVLISLYSLNTFVIFSLKPFVDLFDSVEMPWYVHVNMLEGPGEEKHCAYRATFFK